MIDILEYEKYLKNVLIEKSEVIKSCLNKNLDLESLIERYGNFYYYEALDGHEANKQQQSIFEKYSNLIEFHKLVQQEVIDKVFIGPPELEPEYLKAGRISKQEALKRLSEYWGKYKPYI